MSSLIRCFHMINRKHIIFFALLVFPLLGIPHTEALPPIIDPSQQVMRIGVLARRGIAECLRSWTPTADHLSNQVKGVRFEIIPLTFVEILPNVQAENIDFIIVNSSIYVELQALYGVSRLATLKASESEGYSTLFGGLIFCRGDRSDITSLRSLKGKSFMGVDETSLGGWRAAWREFKANGLNPYADFSSLTFADTHDAVIYAVRDGKVDAGTVATPILEQMVSEGKIDPGLFKVINEQRHPDFPYSHSTGLYPKWPFAKLKHTSNIIAERVAIALLTMSADGLAAKASQSGGWTVPLDYGAVDECLKDLRVGIYKDLGKVSWPNILQYYKWHILLGAGVVSLLSISLLFTLHFNRRLRMSKLDLQKEVLERIQAEAGFRKISHQNDLILMAAGEGILGLDKEGKITFINPAAAQMIGSQADELIGQPHHDKVHHTKLDGSFYPKAECPVYASLSDGKIRGASDEVFWRSDGTAFSVEYLTTPIFEQGNPAGVVLTFRDISERRRVEEAILESERRFRLFYERAPLAYQSLDEDGRFIDVNRAWLNFFGYPKDQVIGRWFGDFMSEDSRNFFVEYFPYFKDTGEMRGVEFEIIRHDTSRAIASFNGSIVYDEFGRFKQTQCLMQDVTERKRAEETLRRQNEYLAALHETSLGLASRLKLDDLLESIIAHASSLVGTPHGFIYLYDPKRGDLEMRSGVGLYKKHVGYRIAPGVGMGGTVWQTGQPLVIENYSEWAGRDPDPRWDGYLTVAAIPLTSGSQVRGVVGVAFSEPSATFGPEEIDILMRFAALASIAFDNARLYYRLEKELKEGKEKEKALRETKDIYRTLLETIPYGVQEIDASGRIIFSNPAHDRIFGYPEGGMVGKSIFELPAEESERIELEKYISHLVADQPTSATYTSRSITGDGRIIDIQVDWNYRRDEEGRAMGFISIITDTSERERLESQLRQAQKMETIGTLAGGIAHDFNNILAAIIGYTEMMREDVSPWSSMYRDVDQVLKASYRARDLVKQILTFSRVGSEQQPIPIEICPIVKEALKMLRASLPSTIEIRQRIEKVNGVVLADPTQIHQLLINLCTNSAHAMREKGGVLEIVLDQLDTRDGFVGSPHCPFLKPGSYLRLAINDTGHGMDKVTMQRIFDPYFTTKAVGEGSGLGLAVVHGIVKRLGGEITVRSEPGMGSSFQVFFPRIEVVAPREMDSPGVTIPRGIEKILFVDDEEPLVKMGKRMLETLGYTVSAHTSSPQALQALREQPEAFDLVLTDHTMPNMTGAVLAGEILKIRPDMPIVLCTGYTEQITEEEAKRMGIREFMMKPMKRKEIAEIIRRALDSRAEGNLEQQDG